MQTIARETLQKMMDRGEDFTLIEVLPADAYQSGHLPGAANASIEDDSFEQQIRKLAPIANQAIVVYSRDGDCPASRRAADKLEEMGYQMVYDYAAGKRDWQRASLPLAKAS